MLRAGDVDAADAFSEGLGYGPLVAVSVEDGDAEGLEDGGTPGDGWGGEVGGVDSVGEAKDLDEEDEDEEEDSSDCEVEGLGGKEGGERWWDCGERDEGW